MGLNALDYISFGVLCVIGGKRFAWKMCLLCIQLWLLQAKCLLSFVLFPKYDLVIIKVWLVCIQRNHEFYIVQGIAFIGKCVLNIDEFAN